MSPVANLQRLGRDWRHCLIRPGQRVALSMKQNARIPQLRSRCEGMFCFERQYRSSADIFECLSPEISNVFDSLTEILRWCVLRRDATLCARGNQRGKNYVRSTFRSRSEEMA